MKIRKYLRETLSRKMLKGFAILLLILGIALPKFLLMEVVFSFLYLIPICVGAWWFGFKPGLAIAVFCTALSGTMNYFLKVESPADPQTLYWDNIIRLFVFTGFAIVIQLFQLKLIREMRRGETDFHTGLLNFRGFFISAQKRLEEARENKYAVSLLYMDLDHFKDVNEKLGHLEGDRALRTVALAMKACFPPPDLTCRFGGDEFIVFRSKVKTFNFENKLKEFQQYLDARMKASNWPVTFSIGCVVYLEPPDSLEIFIREADSLSMEIKNSGRNGLKLIVH